MAVEQHTSTRGMARIPGGSFAMGSERFYPEEQPVHRVAVDGFWIDRHPVTVGEFRRFVTETSYVTVAERPLDAAQYPDADPALLHPGSLVFRKARGPVDLRDFRNWWEYVPGADWRHPTGPGSGSAGHHRHPVTHGAPVTIAIPSPTERRSPSPSRHPRRSRGCRGLRRLGGQDAPDRGRMGVRRPRRAGRRGLRLGRRLRP